ncbi:Fe-S cluster assembly protein SufB [Facklamia sp. DSM 111018]|uniref:Fe-S cluster assembly protein SufB n=1 Tax=Facklamia lactis TaxID=2749967 RepID=A0ABS0LSP1_9LACT|nr:Fe-S cluster assembly protein SufB [Facklamia lactis]MBG9981375.1 Fe-S cluster assembly protein SufB [Facklamia lactis]MBG9987149.1 Fe-S cluster assembly protein SufB [Facklamia lactis]
MSEVPIVGEYEYGFRDDAKILFSTGKGLNEDVVRTISKEKNEPQWMLDFRLKAYEIFKQKPIAKWGVDLSEVNFDDYIYYLRASDQPVRTWEEVPDKIKETFDRLGVPEAERAFLAGTSVQYESETVYSRMKDQVDQLGIIFTDTDTAVQEYPELLREHFASVIKPGENFQTALNSACWSGGSFIYIPKGVKVDMPLQAYFRLNNANVAQFERTLIIVDEGASVHYVEGCTAPTYSTTSMHTGVVEIVVKKNATCRYTTIQNWSHNVYNLVTQRGTVEEGGTLEWVDGNLGSYKTMKYPSCILNGRGARGTVLSIAFAGEGQHQHSGAKIFHNAPDTSSTIVSKSIAKDGGNVDYMGQLYFGPQADGAKSHVECDTIIMDERSKSDTIPFNEVHNANISLEHEAKVSRISEEQLFYLMSRGISEEKATELIIMGFVEPFAKELPLEYAVELNRLIAYEMEGSVG